MDDRTRVGAAVRSARLRRGMPLDVLAGLAGHSKSWLSKVERGLLPLERRADLAALANALGVSPADLTGQPYDDPHGMGPEVVAMVSGIRWALQDAPDPALAAPVDQLVAAGAEVSRRRHALDFSGVGQVLPGLLAGLRATIPTARGADRLQLLHGLFWANHAAQSAARNLGYLDLSWIAAEQVAATANDIGDRTWIAAANFSRSHSLLPAGALRSAHRYAAAAADEATTLPGRDAPVVAGSLMLAASIAAATSGDTADAAARLAAAGELAARASGGVFGAGFSFGASNVALHRLSVELEAGRPEQALAIAGTIRPGELVSDERRSAYWLDIGRAHAQLAHDTEALAAFRMAEQVAPLRVRLHPLVREAVAGMVTRAHQAAVLRDLRGLAYRMGIPH